MKAVSSIDQIEKKKLFLVVSRSDVKFHFQHAFFGEPERTCN